MKNLLSLIILSILFNSAAYADSDIISVETGDTELSIERFPASGKYLIVWLAPEYGLRAKHRSLAKVLSQHGIEVWQSNIAESLFMARGSTSLKNLDDRYVADLIEYAHKTTNKKIIVVGDSYATLNVLRGTRLWQQRKHNSNYLIGAILFTPNTYVKVPPLGQPPEYMPIVAATNIPLMIYQAKNSSNSGQFNTLVEKLQQHGNPVYSRLMPKEISLFYGEEPKDKNYKRNVALSKNINKMISVLARHKVPNKTIALKIKKTNQRGLDIALKKYRGKVNPIAINLKNAHGKTITKNSYKNQITVVNFWATWCTPCIKEIPSLNRLKKKMAGLPFELISINYAEDQKTILDFMKKVNVEFPVLLDPEGSFANQWKVIAYPSTFVIGVDGKIKYGVNAAIEWDSPEVIEKMKELLK